MLLKGLEFVVAAIFLLQVGSVQGEQHSKHTKTTDTKAVALNDEASPQTPAKKEVFAFSLDVGAGLLEFLHADMGFRFGRVFAIGGGIGILPMNVLVDELVEAEEMEKLNDIDGFEITNNIDAFMYSFNLFTRLYPFKGAFFLEGSFTAWRTKAVISGQYNNDSLPDPLTLDTTAKVWLKMLGIHLGWRIQAESGLFLELLVGVNYLLSPNIDVAFSGTVDEVTQSQISSEIDQVEGEIESRINEELSKLGNGSKWLPAAAIRLGWSFGAVR